MYKNILIIKLVYLLSLQTKLERGCKECFSRLKSAGSCDTQLSQQDKREVYLEAISGAYKGNVYALRTQAQSQFFKETKNRAATSSSYL